MTETADESRGSVGRPTLRRTLVRLGQWSAAIVAAALLTVLAIGLGWLPLCTKAAGLSTLGGSVLLVSAVELARRRPRRR